jgi:hypothetical protein
MAMKDTEDLFDKGKNDEEDLLEFEFDELSEEEDVRSSSSDEEVIELVDVVESGEIIEESEPEEIARLLDGEEATEKDEEFGEGAAFSPSEFDRISEEDLPQGLDADLDSAIEEPAPSEREESDFELLESDLEVMADAELFGDSRVESEELDEFEAPQIEPIEEAGMERPAADIPQELPHEGLETAVSSSKEQPEPGEVVYRTEEELIGISEERIEAIITKAVQDVVERVARETMAAVAERVITESIDALKESLQSPQN